MCVLMLLLSPEVDKRRGPCSYDGTLSKPWGGAWWNWNCFCKRIFDSSSSSDLQRGYVLALLVGASTPALIGLDFDI